MTWSNQTKEICGEIICKGGICGHIFKDVQKFVCTCIFTNLGLLTFPSILNFISDYYNTWHLQIRNEV